MENLQSYPQNLASSAFRFNTISASFRTKIRVCSSKSRRFCASSSSLELKNNHELVNGGCCKKKAVIGDRFRVRVKVKVSDAQLKKNWLTSLSCPLLHERASRSSMDPPITNAGSESIIGVDPDVSGALALLKSDHSGCSAQVFDTPHLKMLVGKTVRRRLDAKSIIELLRSFDIPPGTMAYIEQSAPFPQDGKQGWWGGGFGYGLWIGILVASGFSVVPVSSLLWKNHFALSGSRLTKDDSRKAASTLFPSLSSQLTRKKDHGRAEALLIAAYGKGLVLNSNPCITLHHTSELATAEDVFRKTRFHFSSLFHETDFTQTGMSMAEPPTFARPSKGLNGQKQIFSKNIGNATEGTDIGLSPRMDVAESGDWV